MPVCGNYLFFELPKKIVLNPKDGKLRFYRNRALFYGGRLVNSSLQFSEDYDT